MDEQDLTITQDVASNLIPEQTVYDITGEKVGTVDDIDRDTGWFKTEVNPFSDKELYIPFNLVTTIDPNEVYLSRTKAELHRDFVNPPARKTEVEKVAGEEIATTSQASGYDGRSVVVDEVNLGKLRKRIGEGYVVTTSDNVSLGTIKRYDATTGWILVGKTGPNRYDVVIPVTVVSRVDRQFAEVHLAVSEADINAMKHLEPVDVVFADSKPITA